MLANSVITSWLHSDDTIVVDHGWRIPRCVTRGGSGGGLPCHFSKIKKKCPKSGKKMPGIWLSMG